ncbi:flagellar hook-length control protein FliK [Burkholderia diffusa]|uniref:flagellar hook-length control protein FliK n=1 Tax=Burkholderia diffusa TaxID=488732 RepID=UPI0009C040E0|nr:flagellar hook-length control protein FliK [Burkholderia diffusa]
MNAIGMTLPDRAMQVSPAEPSDRSVVFSVAMPAEQHEARTENIEAQTRDDEKYAVPPDAFAQMMSVLPTMVDAQAHQSAPDIRSVPVASSPVEAAGLASGAAKPERALAMELLPVSGIAFRSNPLIDTARLPKSTRALDAVHVPQAKSPGRAAAEADSVMVSRGSIALSSRTDRADAQIARTIQQPSPRGSEQSSAEKPAAASAVSHEAASIQREQATVPRLSTQAGAGRWVSQVLNVLGDRINVQTRQGVEQAVIRLDPQSMGTVHIAIRHEAGTVQIQLVASHEEVARQLQAVGEALRQELSVKQNGDVTVVVRHGQSLGQEERGQQNPHEEAREKRPGKALHEVDANDDDSRFGLDSRH